MCHRGAAGRLKRLDVAKPTAVPKTVAQIRNTDLGAVLALPAASTTQSIRGTP
jgi:hypothetical protein